MAAVEKLIRGPFAEALRKGRERFNAKFAQAQLSGPRLDPGEFLRSLATLAAPVVDAIAAAVPSAADPAADQLYDVILLLHAKSLLGEQPRHPEVVEGWQRLLPAAAPLVARDPRGLAGAVTNALVNLSTAGARSRFWIDEMIAVSALCERPEELLGAGQVLSWRGGLAQCRAGALETARTLRPDIAAAALGVAKGSPLGMILERLERDPWLDPAHAAGTAGDADLRVVAKVGAFRGFGGVFRLPPKVELADGQFTATDGHSSWILAADRFGAVLHPIAGSGVREGKRANSPNELAKDGTVRLGTATRRFPELAGCSSWAANATTVAVTMPLSHRVHLVAQQA